MFADVRRGVFGDHGLRSVASVFLSPAALVLGLFRAAPLTVVVVVVIFGFMLSLFAAWSIVCCSAAVMVALRVLVVRRNVAQLPTRVVAVAMMLGSATVVLLLFVAVAIVSVPVRTPFGFVVFAAVAYSAFRAQSAL